MFCVNILHTLPFILTAHQNQCQLFIFTENKSDTSRKMTPFE